MMFLVLGLVTIAFVVYILFVAFNDAATLLPTSTNVGVMLPALMSPLRTITRSPQGWLSHYIPMGSPTEEVMKHEWLSSLPHTAHNDYPT